MLLQADLGLSADEVTCKEHSLLFNKTCSTFAGGLLVNVGFIDPLSTSNPDVQAGLATLGLGGISEVLPLKS